MNCRKPSKFETFWREAFVAGVYNTVHNVRAYSSHESVSEDAARFADAALKEYKYRFPQKSKKEGENTT